MRPLKLVMQSFGPYREKVELDFTEMQNQSLFLVSGPTGAGKTTIFDALTYALYDGASGNTREKASFKSDFATDTELCFVELAFEVAGKEYFVKRTPAQRGPGKTGKPVNVLAQVELHLPEGQPITKIQEANDTIAELLSLSAAQFRQIVLLPQGEFRKMLDSSSRDKEEIFRNIFETTLLQEFQDELNLKTKQLATKRDEFQQEIRHYYKAVSFSKKEEWKEQIETAIQVEDTPEVLRLLEEQLSEGKGESDRLAREIESHLAEARENETILSLLEKQENVTRKKSELDARTEEMKEKEQALLMHENAAHCFEKKRQVQQAEKDLEETQSQLKKDSAQLLEVHTQQQSLQEKIKPLKTSYEGIEQKRQEIARLEETMRQFTEYEELQQSLDAQKKECREKEEARRHQEKEIETAKGNIKKLEETQAAYEDLSEKIRKNEQARYEAETGVERLGTRLKHVQTIRSLQEKIGEAQEAFQKEEAVFELLDEEYRANDRLYRRNQAGILAKELTAGDPCPVCGSKDHPHPAEPEANVLAEEELEQKKQQAEEQKSILTETSSKISYLIDNKNRLCAELELDPEETDTEKDRLLKNQEQLNQELEEIQKQQKQFAQEEQQNKERKKELEQQKTFLSSLEQERAGLVSSIHYLEDQIQKWTEKAAQLKEVLPETSLESLQTQVTEWQAWINQTVEAYETAREEAHQLDTTSSRLDSAVSIGKETIEKYQEHTQVLQTEFAEMLAEKGLDASFEKWVLEKETAEGWREELSHYQNDLLLQKETARQLKEELAVFSTILSMEEHQEKKEEAELFRQQKEKERQEWLTLLSRNSDTRMHLEKAFEQTKEMEKTYRVFGDLNAFAKGDAENQYVSFERFVLGSYFDEILEAANLRFQTMTNGRFQLLRKTERSKGAGASGLDMEVMDNYNGKQREVSTLSGGESFKASLALALGLSDVIQSQQGGVQVDTLLIDEGFGTLDSDSLDSAIETLVELNTHGRLIGIISHVDELKTRIPVHIEIEKTTNGSRAVILQ